MQSKTDNIRISRTLAYWLRRHPEAVGLTLSSDGWADVDAVLAALAAQAAGGSDDDVVNRDRLIESGDGRQTALRTVGGRFAHPRAARTLAQAVPAHGEKALQRCPVFL